MRPRDIPAETKIQGTPQLEAAEVRALADVILEIGDTYGPAIGDVFCAGVITRFGPTNARKVVAVALKKLDNLAAFRAQEVAEQRAMSVTILRFPRHRVLAVRIERQADMPGWFVIV